MDLLGDAFQEFFVKRDIYRKDGEEYNDYEQRFKSMIRKLEKALKEAGSNGQVPSEIFGWHLLNQYMRMDPSDVANVRGKADTYKMDDVIAALQKMWSGGGLAAKDAEVKQRKRSTSQAMLVEDPETEEIFQCLDGEEDDLLTLELSEAATWYQEALSNFTANPEDSEILATFKEARRALDQAKTARGFYPTRNPNSGFRNSTGVRKESNVPNSSGYNPDANKDCMRCGKRGHIARNCPQRPYPRKGEGKGKRRVSFADQDPSDVNCGFVGHIGTYEPEEQVMTVSGDDRPFHLGYGIVDSGASDNVIGVDTLQELTSYYESLGFDIAEEFEINRSFQKNFVYGSDHSSKSIGLVHMTIGIMGCEFVIDVHIVDGGTPLLLSARFLYDLKAQIDFRSGEAFFPTLACEKCVLERSPGNHLMLSIVNFKGSHAPENEDEQIAEEKDMPQDDKTGTSDPAENVVQKGESRI